MRDPQPVGWSDADRMLALSQEEIDAADC